MFPKFIKALLGLFLIFFIIYGILLFFARPISDHSYFKPDDFLVIAHRGGRSLGPENTLYTFKRAVELGTDVLEMDLQTTSDGALVILHDREVDRTTNGTGAVDSFTLSDLKKLDAGFRWSPDNSRSFPLRSKGITIPTLAEVFKTFPDQRMNIEIKSSQVNTIQNLCRSIRDNRMSQKVWSPALIPVNWVNSVRFVLKSPHRPALPKRLCSTGFNGRTWNPPIHQAPRPCRYRKFMGNTGLRPGGF